MSYRTVSATPRGFTAIELIIVLIIGFSIIILSSSKLGELFTATKTAKTVEHIIALQSAVQELKTVDGYGMEPDLARLMITSGLTPKLISTRGNLMLNAWDQPIAIQSNNATATIALGRIPKAACVKILKSTLANSSFSGIQVNGQLMPRNAPIATMVEQCSVNDNGSELVFVMD